MPVEIGRIEAVFHSALTKFSAAERAAYVANACQGDPELRERVEALLAAHEASGDYLDLPTAANSTAPLSPMESVGVEIGPYRLLEQIGEGGFGVVFLAEQRQPIRRRAALKILKPGMDTRQVVARFQAERQALALMDHPNIAKVFDAGATATGRPYFVMELVKGIAITDYCNQCALTTEARLQLFMTVCQAVQHAHQKGVIHRDIKPSNVLVAINDGEPQAKVIDFGVAKAINQRLTDDSLHTGFAQMIGTPMYMSPEQAEMSALEIDTRGDIYSLGVLLYELLTGTTPFERERLKQASFDELRRIIRHEEPPLPSARLSTLDAEAASTVAVQRRTEPRKLIQSVRGDLDWIVMKCLEKDRTRRYETANALFADVQRYLNHEPVAATPITAGYRLQKFIRRNRIPVGVGAAFAATLLAGTVFSTVMYLKERAAREYAVAKEREAQRAREDSENALYMMQELLAGTDPYTFADPELLTFVLQGIKTKPLAADALDNLGLTLRQRGRFVESQRVHERAIEMSESMPDRPELRARLYNNLGLAQADGGDLRGAEQSFRRAIELGDSVPQPNELAQSAVYMNYGCLLRVMGQLDLAEKYLNKALTIREQAFGANDFNTAETLFHIAEVRRDRGDFTGAEAPFAKVVKSLSENPAPQDGRLVGAMLELATTQLKLGKSKEAEELALKCQELCNETRPGAWQIHYTNSVLGEALLGQKKYPEAQRLLFAAYDGIQPLRPLIPAMGQQYYREILERLVKYHEAVGPPEQVEYWNSQLRTFDETLAARGLRPANH